MQLAGAGRVIEAKVFDVSEQGVGFTCGEAFPKYTVLNVVLGIPDIVHRSRVQPSAAQLKIMFSHFGGAQCRLGAQFVNLSPNVLAF